LPGCALPLFLSPGMGIKQIKIKRWLLMPLTAIVIFLFTQFFAKTSGFVEWFYAQGIYPLIATLVSFFSKWYSFSLNDVFYVLLILSFFVLIILLVIRKISLKMAGKFFLNELSVVFILFYLLWGFNYFRPGLTARLDLKESKPGNEEFMRVFDIIIERANSNYISVKNINSEETDRLIEAGYEKFSEALKISYPGGSRKPKTITFSRFFAYAGISGYFGPFFNEVHVNKNLLPVEYPFILAHEKAHQFGVSNEAEANFYAWLVCSRSPSQEIRYSAYIHALYSFMYQASLYDISPTYLNNLDNRVKDDLRTMREHWQKLRNHKIDKAAGKVYDTYLKTNKVEKGIEDYHGVVKFIMDFSNDKEFRQRLGLD
jgi:hypothetical protein